MKSAKLTSANCSTRGSAPSSSWASPWRCSSSGAASTASSTTPRNVFRNAGYMVSDALLNIAVIGVVNFVFTFVGIYTVDRLGRRPLILWGYIGMAAIFTVLAAAFAMNVQGLPVLALVLASAACFSSTLGPVTWVILSEIFPNRIRGAAMSVSVFALWMGCFALTLSFPILCEMIKPAGTFALYAAICTAGFVFLLRRLPETKGRTLEELERELVP